MSAAALIGFAFAKADLLVSLEAGPGPLGRIRFAVGDARVLGAATEAELMDRGLSALIHAEDIGLLEAFLARVRPGRRRDGLRLRLSGAPTLTLPGRADPERALWTEMSVFRMPGAESPFQCVFSAAEPPVETALVLARTDFVEAAAVAASPWGPTRSLGLGLVETTKAGGGDDPGALDRLRAQAHEGRLLTALQQGRFALVCKADELASAPQTPTWRSKALGMGGVNAQDIRRTLSHVLTEFEAKGLDAVPYANLADAGSAARGVDRADADAVHNAVKAGVFTLAFQPIVSLRTGRLHHYEALIRLPGQLTPSRAIAMAEQSGAIGELDLAVARRVLAALKMQADLRVAMNISAASLASARVCTALARALDGSDEVEGRLIFEIRADSIRGDVGRLHDQLTELRAHGAVFCLDDFGSGTLSLAHLERLPLDMVKFDGPLIQELSRGGRQDVVVRHLVGLCNDLHIKTAAEMVEDIGCETAVMDAGLDFAQGWLYGRATQRPRPPSSDLADRVNARRIAAA